MTLDELDKRLLDGTSKVVFGDSGMTQVYIDRDTLIDGDGVVQVGSIRIDAATSREGDGTGHMTVPHSGIQLTADEAIDISHFTRHACTLSRAVADYLKVAAQLSVNPFNDALRAEAASLMRDLVECQESMATAIQINHDACKRIREAGYRDLEAKRKADAV